MEFLLGFLLGIVISCGFFFSYGMYQVNKMKKIKETLSAQIKAKAQEMDEKKSSIKERLVKASELANAQMAIRSQMETPSKNALHSRYKNGLVGEIQEMEAQKLDLLRTILAEGFDPMITVVNEAGAKTEMSLSAYVVEASGQLDKSHGSATPPPVPLNNPNQSRKAGKFVVFKGGKDDSGTTH